MQLTLSVSYAVGVLLRVLESEPGTTLTAARISKGCKFPPRFLYRVLRRLVDAGIMTGVSGPGGGYALARDARRVTLLQIVQAVEGPQQPTRLVPVHPRHKRAIGRINDLAKRTNQTFEKNLSRVTLAQLAKK